MTGLQFRRAMPGDEAEILRLNLASVRETSGMDGARFRAIREISTEFLVVERDGRMLAFLIGIGDEAQYDNPNYCWFASRLKRFFYIDRVVVSEEARGIGIGSAIYSYVETLARDMKLHWLAAEVNLKPKNSVSLKFHGRHGFQEVGTQVIGDSKIISLQLRPL